MKVMRIVTLLLKTFGTIDFEKSLTNIRIFRIFIRLIRIYRQTTKLISVFVTTSLSMFFKWKNLNFY